MCEDAGAGSLLRCQIALPVAGGATRLGDAGGLSGYSAAVMLVPRNPCLRLAAKLGFAPVDRMVLFTRRVEEGGGSPAR